MESLLTPHQNLKNTTESGTNITHIMWVTLGGTSPESQSGWIGPYISIRFLSLNGLTPPPQIFPWRTISQCTMQMPFVVTFEGLCKVFYRRYPVGFRHDADVIARHRFHEALSHPVAFRTAYRCMFRLKPHHYGQLAHLMRPVG